MVCGVLLRGTGGGGLIGQARRMRLRMAWRTPAAASGFGKTKARGDDGGCGGLGLRIVVEALGISLNRYWCLHISWCSNWEEGVLHFPVPVHHRRHGG